MNKSMIRIVCKIWRQSKNLKMASAPQGELGSYLVSRNTEPAVPTWADLRGSSPKASKPIPRVPKETGTNLKLKCKVKKIRREQGNFLLAIHRQQQWSQFRILKRKPNLDYKLTLRRSQSVTQRRRLTTSSWAWARIANAFNAVSSK